jgi:GNAT superfamily N-acetyltransferase
MNLLDEVLTAPRRVSLRMPDTRVIEHEGWYQVSTPSLRQGGLNEIAFAALDERDADRVIDETLAHYAGRRFRWNVVPGSKPADLGERLAKRGMIRCETWGMARQTTPIAAPQDVEVKSVSKIADYTRMMAEGWGMDPVPLATLHERALAQPRIRMYVARVGGELAGCASYGGAETSAYFIGGVVLPRFRGRGVYRSMIAQRLADACADGISLAITHARAETSAPMLSHLGFQTVCTFETYLSR